MESTDNDKSAVYIDGDKAKTLKTINKYSYSQYGINENGYLYKTDKINKKGSELYSQAIDRCMEDSNTSTTIKYSKNGVDYVYGYEFNIEKTYGGGTTIFDSNEKDPSEIYIFFMKKGLSEKGKWTVPAEQVLMHEIVGHADPIAAGGSRDLENAIENENKVLEQLNYHNQKREVNLWHTARYGK